MFNWHISHSYNTQILFHVKSEWQKNAEISTLCDFTNFFQFQDTEVLMLTTNMIRKDLNSQNTHDAGVALSSLACFMSPDLARDLTGDILTLLTSTKPYIRKKAVLILYKVSRGSKLWILMDLFRFLQVPPNSPRTFGRF